jgi:long-chain fatty acid transport protein
MAGTLFAFSTQLASAQVTSALGDGISAAATGRGGAMAAEPGSALDAIEDNPAGLATIHAPLLELSGIASLGSGSFQNTVDSHGTLGGASGALPYGSFAMPLGKSHWTAAFAETPEMMSRVDWHYLDPPGTAGVTYGEQTNKSKIVTMRSSAGIARALGARWSLGATAGLVYNTNTLNAPYIFQQQPQLAGLKVLLDLDTRGFGWNGSAGATWQPSDKLRLGTAWKSATFIQSHGSANGSASALFAALAISSDPAFHYQAEVDNHLPQSAVAGLHWEPNKRVRVSAEANWVDWASAFRVLPVKLKQGTNATINSVVGSDAFDDHIALHWRNQGALHAGVELPLSDRWTLRGGYAYMSDPVPSKTLTPLTAAILRNSLAAGAGWHRSKWNLDAAYQAQLPASQSVGQSALLAGEYSNSHVQVMEQSLTLTSRVSF